MKTVLDIPRTAMEVFNMLPEGTRCEVIDNTIYISPSPTTEHQIILLRIARRIGNIVEDNGLGEVFVSPCDVYLTSGDDIVQPDICFVTKANSNLITKNGIKGSPDLVIELLSSNKKHDQELKLNLYENNLIPEYIIVNPETKEVWHYKLVDGKYEQLLSSNTVLKIESIAATINF